MTAVYAHQAALWPFDIGTDALVNESDPQSAHRQPMGARRGGDDDRGVRLRRRTWKSALQKKAALSRSVQ